MMKHEKIKANTNSSVRKRVAPSNKSIYKKDTTKADRRDAVKKITVTTSSGFVWDGDEVSRSRIADTYAALEDGETFMWRMADNSEHDVVRAEFKEALRLIGAAMNKIWFKG